MMDAGGRKASSNVSGTSFVGYVDENSSVSFAGWLVDMDDDEVKPSVELEIDGLVVDTVTCNLPRDELLAAGFASATHGFEFRRQAPIPARAEVVIRITGTDHVLAWLAPRPKPSHETMRAFLAASPEDVPPYRREALLTLALNGPEVARALPTCYPTLLGAQSLDEALQALMMHVAARQKLQAIH